MRASTFANISFSISLGVLIYLAWVPSEHDVKSMENHQSPFKYVVEPYLPQRDPAIDAG